MSARTRLIMLIAMTDGTKHNAANATADDSNTDSERYIVIPNPTIPHKSTKIQKNNPMLVISPASLLIFITTCDTSPGISSKGLSLFAAKLVAIAPERRQEVYDPIMQ